MITGALAWILAHAGILGSVGGGAAALANQFLGGWKKWLAIGIAAVAVAGWILVLKLDLAHRDTTIATLTGNAKVAADELATVAAANADNVATLDRLKRHYDAAIDAITADRDRIAAEAQQVQIVKEIIHADVKACPAGNPLPYRDVARWVREHPDPAAARH